MQKKFYAHWEGFEGAPYDTSWRTGQIDTLILFPAIKRSERYRKLKKLSMSEEEIMSVFSLPIEMSVFSWEGLIDTIISPLDSIKYYNYFLHSGLISIESGTGHIKQSARLPSSSKLQHDGRQCHRKNYGYRNC